MSTTSTSTLVVCPGMCGPTSCGEAVEANFGSTKAKTIKVAACSTLQAQGWTGPQLVERKTEARRLTLV